MRAHHARREQQLLQACALGPETTIDTLVGRPKFGIATTPSRETMSDQPPSSDTACTDKGSLVCFAAATVKAWARLISAMIDEGSTCGLCLSGLGKLLFLPTLRRPLELGSPVLRMAQP